MPLSLLCCSRSHTLSALIFHLSRFFRGTRLATEGADARLAGAARRLAALFGTRAPLGQPPDPAAKPLRKSRTQKLAAAAAAAAKPTAPAAAAAAAAAALENHSFDSAANATAGVKDISAGADKVVAEANAAAGSAGSGVAPLESDATTSGAAATAEQTQATASPVSSLEKRITKIETDVDVAVGQVAHAVSPLGRLEASRENATDPEQLKKGISYWLSKETRLETEVAQLRDELLQLRRQQSLAAQPQLGMYFARFCHGNGICSVAPFAPHLSLQQLSHLYSRCTIADFTTYV